MATRRDLRDCADFRVYLSLVAVHSLAENHSDNSSPRRLAVTDYALSRRQHRFKSGRGTTDNFSKLPRLPNWDVV